MSGLDPLVKSVFGNLFSIFSRIIGYTFFGVALNLILLAVQWEWVLSLFIESSSVEDKTIGAVIVTASVLSPVAFFIVGQKQAIQKLLSDILMNKKYEVIYWLVNRLHLYKPELFSGEGKVQVTSLKIVQYTIEALRDLPGIIIKTMRHLINKIDFSDKIVSAINKVENEDNCATDNVERVAEIVSNMIPEDAIEPGIKYPLILIAFNVSFFFL